jgi:formylmethanofuran dehydrogenase subunit E
MAATFVNTTRGLAVRVAAREDARAHAMRLMPAETDPRQAQVLAYRVMNEHDLLSVTPVTVSAALLGRPRVRVVCQVCGEGVNYAREIHLDGLVLCRACAGEAYYRTDAGRAE